MLLHSRLKWNDSALLKNAFGVMKVIVRFSSLKCTPAIAAGGCTENKTLIGEHCHCDYYNHSKETKSKYYCKCGAEFYRPMFAPIFGKYVLIEPYKTVLSGDDECILAIRIDKMEES